MPEFKKDPNERGCLWLKESGRGVYMTGVIDGEPVVVFKNDRKKAGSNQPDWRVLKVQPKAEHDPF